MTNNGDALEIPFSEIRRIKLSGYPLNPTVSNIMKIHLKWYFLTSFVILCSLRARSVIAALKWLPLRQFLTLACCCTEAPRASFKTWVTQD